MTEDTLDISDEDRLPWLEAVEEDDDEGVGLGKMVGGVLVALLVIGLVIGGIFYLSDRNSDGADGELIAAPEDDYRVRPSEAGGMEVEGQGGAAHSASEGGSPEGQIDTDATPEAPVNGRRVASNDEADEGSSSTARIPASDRRLADSAPREEGTGTSTAGTPAASSGRLIQLGAYSSQAAANAAWTQISGSNSGLSALTQTVTQVQSGGRTLYRLRAVASSRATARSMCTSLRNAGQACSVVAN